MQQLELHGRRNFPDFVEEHGAAPRFFQQTPAGRDCPGERPLHMAEQLAFQQVFRQGTAVDGEQRGRAPEACFMNMAGQHGLARARFPFDKHRSGGNRHPAQRGENISQCGTGSEYKGKNGAGSLFFLSGVFRPPEAAVHAPVFQSLPRQSRQIVRAERLGDVIVCAELHGFHGGADGAHAGHDDERRVVPSGLEMSEQFNAGHAGHGHVAQYEIIAVFPESGEGFPSG